MPRTGRRRSLTAAAAFLALLAAPAAAQAATYTVKVGDGPCGGADLACGSLTEAATAAAAGDVFNVSPGTYADSATFKVPGVTVAGAPTFTIDGSIAFTGNGTAPAKLDHVALTQKNSTNAGVISTGTAGLQITDSVILSVSGDGATFSEGTANKIVRSVIATGGTETAAVRVTSADLSSAAKGLLAESSLFSGGVAALSVNTGEGNGLVTTAGDASITLRHVTLAGSTHGLVLDASKANRLIGGPFGNITAAVTDSLIMNDVIKMNYTGVVTGLVITAPPNTVTDSYTRTARAFDPAAYFVDPARRNFRLKAGSPAIDVGGFTEGESTTDIDGQPRPGPTTDLGADEYVAPPVTTPPPPPVPGAAGDGDLPKITVTKPTQNQKLHIFKRVTKTTTVTKKGKKVTVKKKVISKIRNKLTFSGTATDKSGVKGVLVTVERLGDDGKSATGTPAAATAKCKWLNGTKGIVTKSCLKPVVLLAKLGTGTWSYTVKPNLGAGQYRIIVAGADNSGGFGNSATPAEAIRRFTLVK